MHDNASRDALTALTRLVIDWSSTATQRAIAHDAGVEIGSADVRALYMLGIHGRSRIGFLAKSLNQTAPTTSKQLLRLERQDLIIRTSDPDDSRASLTTLTDAGVRLVNALNAVTERRIASALAELHEGERFAEQLQTFIAELLSPTEPIA